MLHVSDLSGKIIEQDSDLVTLVVHDHPLIESPVQLDASKSDVAQIIDSDKDYAVIELIADGGDKSERMVLELAAFDKLFSSDVDEVLAAAEKYRAGPAPVVQDEAPRQRGRSSGAGRPASDKVNYKELPHAGMPHRGRTTDEEAEVVRNNLDVVNGNRVAAGHPPIDPQNEKDAARYGYDSVKLEAGPALSLEFKA
jgi:hypothetical protein